MVSSDRLSKLLFLGSSAVIGFGLVFGAGAVAQYYNLPPVKQFNIALSTLSSDSVSPPLKHMQPRRVEGDGVVVNERPDDDALIMLTGFFDGENQIRLIERDGAVVKKWSLDYFEHFPDRSQRECNLASPLDVDIHGAIVTPSAEVVLNYEYCGTVKLDQCGNMMWSMNLPNHHSLVAAEDGGYWILGREYWNAAKEPDRFPPFSMPGKNVLMREDTVLKVSEDGEILDEFSIPVMLIENGLESVLTANGMNFYWSQVIGSEIVHANQAVELHSEIADQFPQFEAGDLAISMRELNLVIVIDPQTRTVKWHQTGPWIRQHDAEFRPDGRLSIFNNNTYRLEYIDYNHHNPASTARSNIIAIDPVTRETEVLVGETPEQAFLSVVRGQHSLLDDDGTLVVEFDAGRVFEVDADGTIVWDYVNSVDEDWVGEITNADRLMPSYFTEPLKQCSE